jgi:hypothetical protein
MAATDDPVQFEEAIRALRKRVPMTDDVYDQLLDNEREFAFTVADVAQLDVVADVYEAVERAVRDGTTFDDFEAEVGSQLSDDWGGENPARLETIFRTNVMGALNAGRYEAATAPAVAEDRPYWRFDGPEDSRNDEETCGPIMDANVCLPADHAWWQTHYPPLHFSCRHRVTTLSRDQAESQGITDNPPNVRAMPGFGAAPSGGGRDWAPAPRDYPAPLAAETDQDTG